MTEEEAPQPGPDEKIIPKKEAMAILSVSLRTFYKIRTELKEQFDEEPELIWDEKNKRLASLYSMNDIRKMVQIKISRVPGRKPKEEPDA